MNANAPYVKKGYNKQIFAALVESFSRLFLCDEEIVICDLLLHTERSLCDKDIELAIGIPDKKVREICTKMYKQRYLAKDTASGVPITEPCDTVYKPNDKVAGISVSREVINSQCFYRLSNYLVLTVYYKMKSIEELLQRQKDRLNDIDIYICPNCNSTYDGLEVQMCHLDPKDSQFLCDCKTRLVLDDLKKKQDSCESQIRRFEQQTRELKKHLSAAWGMQVPVFAIFNRNKPSNIGSLETPLQRMLLRVPNPITSLPEQIKEKTSSTSPKTTMINDIDHCNKQELSQSMSSSATSVADNITIPFIPKRPASDVGQSTSTNKIKFHMKTSLNLNFKRPLAQANTPVGGRLVIKVSDDVKMTNDNPKDVPNFFISKLNSYYTLQEAENLQDEMTMEEFQHFSDLYDRYLNNI
ncbi:transcription initiation factor TFIIE alpha subunit [Babesia microti strain RI]|uniref:Transcription initiation factor TFIIE alpha subunit n=1 Tax=Babesia microti (strain RI) TaxID=1133968 RepID=A0A1R4ABG3_BABMR|nr:transcription initiation factor TFIIE alpha subunit [Babesia microti strain RI]SJK86336.1 transcription initiation factor TFIIE alpha subunit [Babesia microti strain RI]|eukprot:XP_021338506.1 transcription initiation factor TFIIE alpha subunit [Babesia microti strain RI]